MVEGSLQNEYMKVVSKNHLQLIKLTRFDWNSLTVCGIVQLG